MRAWFADEITAGVDSGEFQRCDPEEVADRALALLDGFGVRTLIGDSAIPLERARRAVGVGAGARASGWASSWCPHGIRPGAGCPSADRGRRAAACGTAPSM